MSVNASVFVNMSELGHCVGGESWHATKVYCPSSQGWAPCVLPFFLFFDGDFFPLLSVSLLVCYTVYIFMYIALR